MKSIDAAAAQARRDVASALIERLPEWPAPDMLSECDGSFVIMWDLGDEIAGTVVWDQMISVFWAGYQEVAETPGAAAEMLYLHVETKWQPIETAPSEWRNAGAPNGLKDAVAWQR